MTTIIDVPEARELLRKAVEKRGKGFVYRQLRGEPCLYWHKSDGETPSEPGCMVGLALALAGVVPDKIVSLDDYEDGTSAGSLPDRDLGDFKVTDDAAIVFAEAQAEQDNEGTWGYALTQAERLATRIEAERAEVKPLAA